MMSDSAYDSTDEYCCEDMPIASWVYSRSEGPRPYKRCGKEHYTSKEAQVELIENNASLIIPFTPASLTSSSASSSSSSSSSAATDQSDRTLTDCANHCGARLRSSHPAVQLDHNTFCPKQLISCFLCGLSSLTNDQLWTTHIAGGQCPNYVVYCSSFGCERKEDKEATKRWRTQRLLSNDSTTSEKKQYACKKVLNRSDKEAKEFADKAAGFVQWISNNKYPMSLFGWGGCDLSGGSCSFAKESTSPGNSSSAAQGGEIQLQQLRDFRNDHAHDTYARNSWESRRFLSQSCANYTNDPNFDPAHSYQQHPIAANSSSSSSSIPDAVFARNVVPNDAKILPPYSNVASLEVCPHCSVRMMVSFWDPSLSTPTSLLHPTPLSHNDRLWSPYYPMPDPVEPKPYDHEVKGDLLSTRADFEEHVKACANSTQQLDALRSQLPHGSYLTSHRLIPNLDHILRDVHTHEVFDDTISARCGTSKFNPRNPDWNWLKSVEQRTLEEEARKNLAYSQQANMRTRQIQSHIVSQSSSSSSASTVVNTITASSSPVTEGAVAAVASPDAAGSNADVQKATADDHDVVPVFWTYSQCLVQNLLLELGQIAVRGGHAGRYSGRLAWTMRCEESDDEEEEADAAPSKQENIEHEEDKSQQAHGLSRAAKETLPSGAALTPAVDSLDQLLSSTGVIAPVRRGPLLQPTETPAASASSTKKYRRAKHAKFNDDFGRALEIMALTLFKQGANSSDLVLPYRTRAPGQAKSYSNSGDEFDERYYRWSTDQPRFLNADELLSNLSQLQRPLVYPFVEQVMIPDLANMVLEYF